jgi:protein-tyrosine phosphatase
MRRVLMVCMGNLCRSPMAASCAADVAREMRLEKMLQFDSAGISGGHAGEKMDPRAKAALLRRGRKPANTRSRRIEGRDFERFDLILAMDSRNLTDLQRTCPPEHRHKLKLLLDFAERVGESEIPDPYYGNVDGFERVLDLCEAGARGLIQTLARA